IWRPKSRRLLGGAGGSAGMNLSAQSIELSTDAMVYDLSTSCVLAETRSDSGAWLSDRVGRVSLPASASGLRCASVPAPGASALRGDRVLAGRGGGAQIKGFGP